MELQVMFVHAARLLIDAMDKYGHTPKHWVMGSLEKLSLNSSFKTL